MLDGETELYEDLRDVYEAFWRLDASRARGMGGAGRIPWEVIDRYAERQGIEDAEEFEDLIRAMDDEYLSHADRGKPDA